MKIDRDTNKICNILVKEITLCDSFKAMEDAALAILHIRKRSELIKKEVAEEKGTTTFPDGILKECTIIKDKEQP